MNKIVLIVLCVGLMACNKKKEEEGREPVAAAPAPGPASAGGGSVEAPGQAGFTGKFAVVK